MEHGDDFLLPLFPLNVVLYPGMLLPVHVFEPCYRTMVHQCLGNTNAQCFGVVLIAHGQPEEEPAIPNSVGTIAQIAQVQHLNEDQMNIWVVGTKRFEILDYYVSSFEYLMGRVRKLYDIIRNPQQCEREIETINQLFKTYIELKLSISAHNVSSIVYRFSGGSESFSFQIASVLDISLAEKQKLLGFDDVFERLQQETAILKREIMHLQQMLVARGRPRTQPLPWGGEINLN